MELLYGQVARHRMGGAALLNNYTIQELKSYSLLPFGAGLSHAQSPTGEMGWG